MRRSGAFLLTAAMLFLAAPEAIVVASEPESVTPQSQDHDGGSSKVSAMESGSPSLPAAPANTAATVLSSTSIQFAWSDNSDNEDGFRVYRWSVPRRPGVGGRRYDGGEHDVIRDTGLQPSSHYFYFACAYNVAGEACAEAWLDATRWSFPGSRCRNLPRRSLLRRLVVRPGRSSRPEAVDAVRVLRRRGPLGRRRPARRRSNDCDLALAWGLGIPGRPAAVAHPSRTPATADTGAGAVVPASRCACSPIDEAVVSEPLPMTEPESIAALRGGRGMSISRGARRQGRLGAGGARLGDHRPAGRQVERSVVCVVACRRPPGAQDDPDGETADDRRRRRLDQARRTGRRRSR